MTVNLLGTIGFIGIFSTAAWIGVLVALVRVWQRGGARRPLRLGGVLGAALLAVLCTRGAWRHLASVQVDRTERYDHGTPFVVPPDTPAAAAGEEGAAATAGEPAYRQRGRQSRADGMRPAGPDAMTPAGVEKADARTGQAGRLLSEQELRRAMRLGRMNRQAATGVFWLAVLALATDYLRRFHSLMDCYAPVPLDGRIWNRLVRKPAVQPLPAPALPAACATLVRRGETFLYCGPATPVPDPGLPRWKAGRFAHGMLPALTPAAGPVTTETLEFLLDAAWFGRAFVLVHDPAVASRLMAVLPAYLAVRQLTRAWAARTVYVIWDFPPPVDPARWQALQEASVERNLCWIVPVPA